MKVGKYKLVVVVIYNPYNPAEFVVIPCSDSVVRTANTLSGYPHSQAPPSLIPRLVGMRLAPKSQERPAQTGVIQVWAAYNFARTNLSEYSGYLWNIAAHRRDFTTLCKTVSEREREFCKEYKTAGKQQFRLNLWAVVIHCWYAELHSTSTSKHKQQWNYYLNCSFMWQDPGYTRRYMHVLTKFIAVVALPSFYPWHHSCDKKLSTRPFHIASDRKLGWG